VQSWDCSSDFRVLMRGEVMAETTVLFRALTTSAMRELRPLPQIWTMLSSMVALTVALAVSIIV
jgi:hypothetical protein